MSKDYTGKKFICSSDEPGEEESKRLGEFIRKYASGHVVKPIPENISHQSSDEDLYNAALSTQSGVSLSLQLNCWGNKDGTVTWYELAPLSAFNKQAVIEAMRKLLTRNGAVA